MFIEEMWCIEACLQVTNPCPYAGTAIIFFLCHRVTLMSWDQGQGFLSLRTSLFKGACLILITQMVKIILNFLLKWSKLFFH